MGALTIGNVAAEAGVYKAAVSYHFGGKAGLIATIVIEYFDETDALIAKAACACPPGKERVRFIVENWLDYVGGEQDLLFFDVLGYVLRKRELRNELQALYQRWTDLILTLLLEDAAIPPDGGRKLALLIRMLIDGMVVERLIQPDRGDWKVASEGLAQLVRLYAGFDAGSASAD